jgi:drug/metabolite transporter (DMT)-like permease
MGKIALRALPSTGVVAFRAGGAAVLLLLGLRVVGGKPIERKDYGRLAVYSLLGIVLNQLLFVKGLELSTAVNAALLAVTIPVFALLVSAALGRDKLTWRKLGGVALAALGVVYLIDPARADFSQGTAAGNLLMVANALAYGAYIAISQDVFQRYGAITALTWIFVFGALITVPIGAYNMAGISWAAVEWRVWAAIASVIVMTAAAYFLNAWALARVNPATVAVYIYLQPLIAFAVAPFILGETWNTRTVAAGLLIFSGVALVTRKASS